MTRCIPIATAVTSAGTQRRHDGCARAAGSGTRTSGGRSGSCVTRASMPLPRARDQSRHPRQRSRGAGPQAAAFWTAAARAVGDQSLSCVPLTRIVGVPVYFAVKKASVTFAVQPLNFPCESAVCTAAVSPPA